MQRKIDWKKWSESFWQKIRIYAALLAVLALGVGLYGVHIARSLSEGAPALAPVHDQAESAQDMPSAPQAALEPPDAPTAADITPVRVALTEQETADAQAALPAAQTAQTAEQPSQEEQPPVEEAQPPQEEQSPVQPQWVYADPSELAAGSAPVQGQISRGYGFTLDTRYADYRYHNGVDYQITDNRSVYAVMAGTVAAIDETAQAVTIAQGDLRMIYQPVGDMTVSLGQAVTSGRALGNVPQGEDTLHLALQKR